MKVNYQVILDKIIEANENKVPTLLLHSCCAPCSSYVLKYLGNYFKITLYFYNPNIYPKEEYDKRLKEQKRLIKLLKVKYPIDIIEGVYEPNVFLEQSLGLEKEREGYGRCFKCYRLRLEKTAKKAKELKFDYFTTTLTVSPYKNSDKINLIGSELEKIYNVDYLYSDFKKKEGYKQSIELSKEYNLYRQDYCGCQYSIKEN